MRRWKLLIAVSVVFLGSCGRDGGVIEKVRLGDIQGTFVIEDDERTTPLTRVRHSIYYVGKEERSLIFEGTGGSKPTLWLLTPDTVLIRYCGGSIDHAASFLEGPPRVEGSLRLFRVQPITSVGISANGRQICEVELWQLSPTNAPLRLVDERHHCGHRRGQSVSVLCNSEVSP